VVLNLKFIRQVLEAAKHHHCGGGLSEALLSDVAAAVVTGHHTRKQSHQNSKLGDSATAPTVTKLFFF